MWTNVSRGYTVTVRHDVKGGAPVTQDVDVDAYDLIEAMMTAALRYKRDHGLSADESVTAIDIRPKSAMTPGDLLARMMSKS